MEPSGKTELRAQVRALVRAMATGERERLSRSLCSVMLAQECWLQAITVLLFVPLADEPDLSPLLEAAWQGGKLVAVPRFDPAIGAYAAAQVKSRAQLVPGRFGVLEPDRDCPVTLLNQLDLTFVPGVAFDLTGRRLGRGKGFYDRLLAGVQGHKCGVAFDEQIVAQVPEEPHDIRLDSLLTPTRWCLSKVAD